MYNRLKSENLDNKIREIDNSIFEEEVVENSNPVLVEFTVDWCQPCQRVSEILHELSEGYGDKIDFFSVDVDKNKALSKKYNVELLPTLVFLNKGKIIESMVGNQSKDRVNNQLSKMLKE